MAGEVAEKLPYGEHDRRFSGTCAPAQALARLIILSAVDPPAGGAGQGHRGKVERPTG
jgi:hypothetical protein